MANKNKPKRRTGFSANTVYRLVRIGALLAPAAAIAMTADEPAHKLREGLKAYTGFDITTGGFNWQDLQRGWMPSVGAAVATYGVPKIGSFIRNALKF